jgi:hypothetical protein
VLVVVQQLDTGRLGCGRDYQVGRPHTFVQVCAEVRELSLYLERTTPLLLRDRAGVERLEVETSLRVS